ncbi:hypothetical protein F5B17DRAFT_290782 [Nemania serpens]|nr:hypothetical protein F5B17DRAFT_290782 [Nemania serpens]
MPVNLHGRDNTIPFPLQSNIGQPGMQSDAPAVLEPPQCDCMRVATESHNGQAPESVGSAYWRDLWSPLPEISSPIWAPSAPPSEPPPPTPVLSVSTSAIKSEPISPLILPPPPFSTLQSPRITRARSRRLPPPTLSSTSPSSPGRVTRSRKRKVPFGDELEPPRKRRRLQ